MEPFIRPRDEMGRVIEIDPEKIIMVEETGDGPDGPRMVPVAEGGFWPGPRTWSRGGGSPPRHHEGDRPGDADETINLPWPRE
jgi:hypothetical protein